MQNKIFFILLAVLALLFVATHFYNKNLRSDFNYYSDVEILPDSYLPWEPVEFTYTSYSGAPGIDEAAFADEYHREEGNRCLVYGAKRLEGSLDALQKQAAEGDAYAMYEVYLRLPEGDEKLKWLLSAAAGGHLEARLLSYLLVADIPDAKNNMNYIAEHYETLTPLATYVKMVLGSMSGNADLKDIERGKTAGGSYGIVANALISEIKYTGQVDHELFCEAYYRGCISLLYELKQRHRISCERQ